MSAGVWTVIGAGLGAVTALLAGYVDRAHNGRAELIRAASAWIAATEALTVEARRNHLMSEPPSTPIGDLLETFVKAVEATIGPGRIEVLRSLVHRPIVRRIEAVADRVMEANALLILTAPPGLIEDIAPHMDALGARLTSPGDPEVVARWENEARPLIIKALRKHTQPLSRCCTARLTRALRRLV